MTEREWLACKTLGQMIDFLVKRNTSSRRLRLFACSWFRGNKRYDNAAEIVEVGERMADGKAQQTEINKALSQALQNQYTEGLRGVYATVFPDIIGMISSAFIVDFSEYEKDHSAYFQSIYDIFGNPFRRVSFDNNWRTRKVLALAKTIYDQRAYDLMPILADEVEEAGCDIADLLSHCRGDGPHVRGCWAVDQVLGKN